jgi:transposase
MTKQERSFFTEFKREAASLMLDQGYSHIEACRSLGVVESALCRLVNQHQMKRSGVNPQNKISTLIPEQVNIQKLEARIARLLRRGISDLTLRYLCQLRKSVLE